MNEKIKFWCRSQGVSFDDMSWELTDFMDGRGIFISRWDLPVPQPTPEQLDAITEAEIEAEARQADLIANGTRYVLQNQYLDLCDQLSGRTDHHKLGFAELQEIIAAMQAVNPAQAMSLALQLLTLDAALKREGGLLWWDSCEWRDLP